jgi:hypothetical protein
MSLLFFLLVAICVAHSLSPVAYRLLRFFIALSLSLSKSVSVGLSIAYLRADSCALSIPGISVYSTRYKPVRALARL